MTKTTSGHIIDIDIQGRQNYDGSAVELIDAKAISNAMQMFLSSSKGDFLYAPSSGGVLSAHTFRTMNLESLTMLQFNIRNAITNGFSPAVELFGIDLTPDYESHALKIDVTYRVVDERIETTTVYVNADFNIKRYDFIDVNYEGKNLLTFCQLKKSEMTGQYLELETNTEVWAWGQYRFTNLTEEDEYFSDILLICNS